MDSRILDESIFSPLITSWVNWIPLLCGQADYWLQWAWRPNRNWGWGYLKSGRCQVTAEEWENPIHGLDGPGPLIGHSLPVLASDWSMLPHHPCPASLWWGLVSQESNIRFMPQQQISMTLNLHTASSILAFCHVLFIYCWSFWWCKNL